MGNELGSCGWWGERDGEGDEKMFDKGWKTLMVAGRGR